MWSPRSAEGSVKAAGSKARTLSLSFGGRTATTTGWQPWRANL